MLDKKKCKICRKEIIRFRLKVPTKTNPRGFYYRYMSDLQWSKVKVCSKRCSGDYLHLLMRDKPKYKSRKRYRKTGIDTTVRMSLKYRQWRERVFMINQKSCTFCNSTKVLQTDHIIPLSILLKKYNIKTLEDSEKCRSLWNVKNGRVVCKKCHDKLDTSGWNLYNNRHKHIW